MIVERTGPPLTGTERELLTTFLDYHRATLATKCHGLTGDQLRKVADPPSALSLLGLLRHLGRSFRNRQPPSQPTTHQPNPVRSQPAG